MVASWELLTTLMCLDVFTSGNEGGHCGCVLGGATDNKGNSYAVAKLLTSKFPLNVVLVQLSCMLEQRGLWLDLEWTPREQNVEADALTNEDFTLFDPLKRIEVNWSVARYPILEKFMARGVELFTELEAARRERREAGVAPKDGHGRAKRRKRRESEPW